MRVLLWGGYLFGGLWGDYIFGVWWGDYLFGVLWGDYLFGVFLLLFLFVGVWGGGWDVFNGGVKLYIEYL